MDGEALTAVVVGAGVGGLTAAGGLAHAGWRVTLLERADRLRAEPTAMLLGPSGVRALQTLGVGGGLAAVASEVPAAGVRRPDGQLRMPRAAQSSPPSLLIHSEDLHDALVAGLSDRVEVHTSVAARIMPAPEAASQRPAVTDGRRIWQADLLVAADGIGSTMRAAVAPRTEVVAAGATTWRAVIPWYRTPEIAADQAGITQDGAQRFRFAGLGERSAAGTSGRGGLYWSATMPGAARPESPEVQLELLRRWFSGWHRPIPQLLAATEAGDVLQQQWWTLRRAPQRLSVRAGAGAMVLLGDAAHGLADQLGQGASVAAADAAELVMALRQVTAAQTPQRSLHAAVTDYDRARRRHLSQGWITVVRRLLPGGRRSGPRHCL